MRTRVYISGPISKGGREHNWNQAMEAHRRLIDAGLAPLNPILTMAHPDERKISHDDWLEVDLPWVECAAAVLRLPGESAGADEECQRANDLNIPIFHSIEMLIAAHENGCFARPDYPRFGRALSIVDESLRGNRGLDQMRIATTGLHWVKTILQKNRDYGASVWQTPALAPNMDVADAIFVRMSDKVARIATLKSLDNPEVAESLDDTIADLGSYCLLYLSRPRDEENEELPL